MFERITQDEYYKQYTPTILSQPGVGIGKYKDDGPWVITLHNVVSNEECDELINLGGVRGYEQSYDVGKKKYDGGGSAADHMSAMSLSIGDMNEEGNLSSVFDTSLRISHPSDKETPSLKKKVKDKSSSNWEGERFDMSVATIGGASRFSEAGNMSYATFSEDGQMSFSKVFEDPDKLG